MGERPTTFSTLYQLKRGDWIVRPMTRLVIEGAPRATDTFVVWAFEQAQHEEVRGARHASHPARAIRAAWWRIPTLVLLK